MLRFLAASFLLLLAVPARAAVPVANLVNDEAAIVLVIEDAPTLLKNWDQSPWARTWQDEQIKKFFAPMRAQMKADEWDDRLKSETGYTLRELLAFAQGGALFALSDFQFALKDGKEVPPFIFVLELGDKTAAVEKLLTTPGDQTRKITEDREEFSGVAVHIRKRLNGASEEEGDFVWAMTEGLWLVSPVKEKVFAAIDAVKRGGAENAFGKSERFLRLKQRQADAQMVGLLNFQAIYPTLKAKVAEAKKEGDQTPNALGLDPETVLGALGLDTLRDLFFTSRIGEEATEVHGGLTYGEERGLVKLLAYREGPAPRPAFVPAKWPSVSSTRFSLPGVYAATEELLAAISPALSGMVQAQIKTLGQRVGLDFKQDFIGSIGDEIITGYALRTGLDPSGPPSLEDMDQVFVVSLDNAATFTRAIDSLKRLGGPGVEQILTKRDYLGTPLFTFTPPAVEGQPPAKGFSYAITERYLVVSVGTPGAVESALQGMKGGQPSFWEQEKVKLALADVPERASAIQYHDMRLLMTTALETFSKLAALTPAAAAAPDGDDAAEPAPRGPMVDVNAKPDAETIGKYWGDASGYAYREGNGIYSVSKLNHPK